MSRNSSCDIFLQKMPGQTVCSVLRWLLKMVMTFSPVTHNSPSYQKVTNSTSLMHPQASGVSLDLGPALHFCHFNFRVMPKQFNTISVLTCKWGMGGGGGSQALSPQSLHVQIFCKTLDLCLTYTNKYLPLNSYTNESKTHSRYYITIIHKRIKKSCMGLLDV